MDFIAFLIVFIYVLFLIVALDDFHKLRIVNKGRIRILENQISWIIPFRNEEKNIPEFLVSLESQNNWKELYEIIFIDDNSDDNGVKLINKFIEEQNADNIKIVKISVGNASKKSAILESIENIHSPWVLQTDMDIQFGRNWLEERTIVNESTLLSIAPIKYLDGGFFSKILNIENWAIIAMTVIGIKRKIPQMANGANLLWNKKIIEEGNAIRREVISGDDTDLMNASHSIYKDSLDFNFKKGSVVNTYPPGDLTSFFHQRIRWASKWKNSKFNFQLFFAAGIWAFHLIYISILILLIYKANYALAAIIFSTKALSEYYLISGISHYFNSKISFVSFLISLLIYSPYVVFFGLFGQFVKAKWK